MKIRVQSATLVLLAVLIPLAGCGAFNPPKDAERLISDHYKAIGRLEFQEALSHYGPQFFQNITPVQWKGILETNSNKLGDFESFTVENWQVKSIKRRLIGHETYVVFRCLTKYRYGKATEKFTVHKSSDEQSFAIVGHIISAKRETPKQDE